MNGFSFDRLRMREALYRQLIDTAGNQFGQMASDNRQKPDSPATIYTMVNFPQKYVKWHSKFSNIFRYKDFPRIPSPKFLAY